MIGVVPKPDQAAAVGEFFELFKTPWELYRPGRRYDVVVATADDVPDVDAALLLVFGSTAKSVDAPLGIVARARVRDASIDRRGTKLPIYGELLTFEESGTAARCDTSDAGIASVRLRDRSILRVGYDVFDEVRLLLSSGQPAEHAGTPAVDIHVARMREWIVHAGVPLLEIPPAPAGRPFIVCLTHDIDFDGIRRHLFDHTMFGFVYRSTIGAFLGFLKRRMPLSRLLRTWRAAASLPLVYAGWIRDFWDPFDWYLQVERGLPATYFLIPFKRRAGERVESRDGKRRATAYDVTDVSHRMQELSAAGCEIGVHGIDAWHDAEKGSQERSRVAAASRTAVEGIRMHWLLSDSGTPRVLENAGYVYDSTAGFNETIGYLAGTSQVFRPPNARVLLELPLHIQDGALFYPRRLDLTDEEAEARCADLIANAARDGGVLTVLWHDRSHGPERFWGDFYLRLIDRLKASRAWFATASQAVAWFQRRRDVRFEPVRAANGAQRICVRHDGDEIRPALAIRLHQRGKDAVDIPWNGRSAVELDGSLETVSAFAFTDVTREALS